MSCCGEGASLQGRCGSDSGAREAVASERAPRADTGSGHIEIAGWWGGRGAGRRHRQQTPIFPMVSGHQATPPPPSNRRTDGTLKNPFMDRNPSCPHCALRESRDGRPRIGILLATPPTPAQGSNDSLKKPAKFEYGCHPGYGEFHLCCAARMLLTMASDMDTWMTTGV